MSGLLWKCSAFVGVVVLGVAVGGGASVANASSYLRLDGVTVDPIQYSAASGFSGNHFYTGPNLGPGVQAPGALLYGADLTLASLNHADLMQADVTEADLSGANLSGANLWGLRNFSESTSFAGANLSNADFSVPQSGHPSGKRTPILTGANLTNANLSYRDIRVGADGATFTGANLFYVSFTSISAKNLTAVGADFNQAGFYNTDLSGSNFSGTSFLETEFSNANFTNTNLVGADLSVQWEDTDLSTVDFTGATYSTGSLSNRTLFPAGFDPVVRGMVLVPEVSTGLMVGIGLLGMALNGKKRKRVH